jgi:hypothetical protein
MESNLQLWVLLRYADMVLRMSVNIFSSCCVCDAFVCMPTEGLIKECTPEDSIICSRGSKMPAASCCNMCSLMQFTRMLDVLDAYLDDRGHRAARIDGSMSYQQRIDHIETFNNDADCFAFLLSTRAGGLGLNLTAADTVIIYDSDWNPHQDMQVCACSLHLEYVGKTSICVLCDGIVSFLWCLPQFVTVPGRMGLNKVTSVAISSVSRGAEYVGRDCLSGTCSD